jgi:hypothetical protein
LVPVRAEAVHGQAQRASRPDSVTGVKINTAERRSTALGDTARSVSVGHESPSSAAGNVVIPMHKFGLIDDDGNLTDHGHKWRTADGYAEACQEILDEIYPANLAAFTTADGGPDKPWSPSGSCSRNAPSAATCCCCARA